MLGPGAGACGPALKTPLAAMSYARSQASQPSSDASIPWTRPAGGRGFGQSFGPRLQGHVLDTDLLELVKDTARHSGTQRHRGGPWLWPPFFPCRLPGARGARVLRQPLLSGPRGKSTARRPKGPWPRRLDSFSFVAAGRPLDYLTFRDLGKLIYPLQSKAALLRLCKIHNSAVTKTKHAAGAQGNVRFCHRRRSQVDPLPAAVFRAMPTLPSAERATEILLLAPGFHRHASGGFRIQRDSDSSACPNVVCSNCGAAFRREPATHGDAVHPFLSPSHAKISLY